MNTELKDFLDSLELDDNQIFTEIANYANELGYKGKRAKTKDVNYVFTNSKTKKHLLKFSLEKGKPVLKLKFYASKNYSELFRESIRSVIEEYDFRYTGCYKCGKCKDVPEGYLYEYPDGKKYFRCGGELISLLSVNWEVIEEIKGLLKRQHEHYLSKA